MRARASRLAVRLMFGASVTTNVSQRIGRPLVHLPVPVTFNLSQLGSSDTAKNSFDSPAGSTYKRTTLLRPSPFGGIFWVKRFVSLLSSCETVTNIPDALLETERTM